MAYRKKTNNPNARSFAGIPRIVMDSEDFKGLSGNAVKLLLALANQYRGKNNGDLTTAWSIMHAKFGFKSPGVVTRAKKQLLDANMIVETRTPRWLNPGGKCGLYALVWQAIDDCPGKQLERNATITPPRRFSMEKNKTPSTEMVPTSIPNQYRQAATST
jgi:hypothetical protein